MNVRVHIEYDEVPSKDDRDSLLSLGRSLTNDRKSVVVEAAGSNKLIVEFTMPDEAQYKAVSKIDRAVESYADDGTASIIEFPKTTEEREGNRRKTARRRAQRRPGNEQP